MPSKTIIEIPGARGVKLIADAHGDRDNPAVVFLHGGGQTRHAWGDAAERFAREGFYTLTIDLRGHGDSGWAPDGDYEIESFVADLHRVLASLPGAEGNTLPLPVIVGASLGGVTGLVAIGTAKQAIARGLVLVDIVPRINPEGGAKIANFMRANPDGFASVEEAADAVAAYLPHRPRPKDVSGLKKNLRLGDNGRYYWHWDPKFIFRDRDFDALTSKNMLEAAAQNVHIPTLLVKGSLSEIVDDEGVEAFRRVLPKGEVVDVQGAGHMVAGDKNNAFDDEVLKFLKGL